MNNPCRPGAPLLLLLLCMAGCTRYEHTNPLDPRNPSSSRPLSPVALAFLYNDTSLNANSLYRMACDAYLRLEPPAFVLSLDIPMDPYTNSLKEFLKNEWEVMSGPRLLPRVFVGDSASPIEGLSTSQLHLDTLNARIQPLLYRSACWTLEGKASVNGASVTLEIKIARLGDTGAAARKVMAFVMQKRTEAFGQAFYAFPVQPLRALSASEITTVSFSRTLSSAELPSSRAFLAIVHNGETGEIEQGVAFE